jgi:hypothetical protein
MAASICVLIVRCCAGRSIKEMGKWGCPKGEERDIKKVNLNVLIDDGIKRKKMPDYKKRRKSIFLCLLQVYEYNLTFFQNIVYIFLIR